jgi:hypothetical protein
MEVRPGKRAGKAESRGSGPGARKKRSDAIGARKDVIIRMPEAVARQLKIAAACEDVTITDFCLEAILPKIDKTLEKHGMHPDK